MSTIELLTKLRNSGARLWLEGEMLRFQAPKGAVSRELLDELSQKKSEVILFLQQVNSSLKNSGEQILPVSRAGQVLPASFSQQSLWFFDQLTPHNPVYNIPNAIRIKGELKISAMEAAINQICLRHEALRTTLRNENGKPVLEIAPEFIFNLEVKELISFPISERETELKRKLQEEAWKPFDLENGPLWRAVLFKLDEKEFVLIFTIHHIISDAWSSGIFVKEFLSLYEGFSSGKSVTLPQLPIQFADYAYWQRRHFEKPEFVKPLLDYWIKQLANPTALQLPTDHPRPAIQSFSGKTRSILFTNELTEKIKEICINEDVTIFMLLLAVFKILLYRYSGQEDIIIGTVVANRNRIEVTGLIGFIMNTLVLRNDLSGNPSFQELLRRVKKTTLSAYANQELPFDMLLEELKPERDLSRTPLFQVMFIHQSIGEVSFATPNLKIETVEIENCVAPFDLRMITRESPQGIICQLDYCTALYEEETIVCLLEHYKTLLEAITADLSGKIGNLPILSEKERQQILVDFNNSSRLYPVDKCIHKIFEDQVEKSPDTIAAIFENEQLTYRELNFKANQLAHFLKEMGVGPDVTVGVCLGRSLDMPVSLLAILKAGGAYVPFDPNYPKERISFMMRDAKVEIMITWERLLSKIPEYDGKMLCLDRESEAIANKSIENPLCNVADQNLAYVIYTSGSTGNPKGAMNTHLGMRNHKQWMQEVYKLTPEDRILQKTPFSFDVSVWEFFWPLITGARMVIAKPEGHKDPDYLIKTIIERGITVIHFVPAMLNAFLEHPAVKNCVTLRQVFCSGEAISINLQHRFYNLLNIPLHNVYGPAECADVSTAWTCDNNYDNRIIPIGKPISNVRVYILDKHLNPVPIGVPGELYIGGSGVGRGYINNPQLTAEKFIPDPISGEPGSIMYQTGDKARYRRDGNIEYLGRVDFQVKIRGLRIELGEIESRLLNHPHIKEVVVIAHETENGDKFLCAYMVNEAEVTVPELRKFLSESLPDYMIPAFFVQLEKMPLLPNGKIDRKALPKPVENINISSEYTPPRNSVEEKLVEIWREILKIDKIGINDNFFTLGGHSLLATTLVAEIAKTFQKNISLQYFFENPTIAELALLFCEDSDESMESEEDYEEGEL